jgi:hypothetical protein
MQTNDSKIWAAGIGAVLIVSIWAILHTPTTQPELGISNVTLSTFNLKLGKMADYGASPWYTDELAAGASPIKLNFDTGANFMWATSDKCSTDACNTHDKVNTTQSSFVWLDKTTTKRSFGPWGDMYTWTGQVPFNSQVNGNNIPPLTLPFFASVEYNGNKFKYLAWDGGFGFPSENAIRCAGIGCADVNLNRLFYFSFDLTQLALASKITPIIFHFNKV